jgi:hypothetical protein
VIQLTGLSANWQAVPSFFEEEFMDLRAYYKKVREVESQLPGPFVVVVSIETPDGGKAGVCTEVARLSAAKQIADNRARVATQDEADAFHFRNELAREAYEREAAVSKMQFVVVPAKNDPKGSRE